METLETVDEIVDYVRKGEEGHDYFIESIDLNTERVRVCFILFKSVNIREHIDITLLPREVPTYYSKVSQLSRTLLKVWGDVIFIKNSMVQPEIDYTSDYRLIFDCYSELINLNLSDLAQLAVKYERFR